VGLRSDDKGRKTFSCSLFLQQRKKAHQLCPLQTLAELMAPSGRLKFCTNRPSGLGRLFTSLIWETLG